MAVIRHETIWGKRENGELFSVPGRWGLGLGEFGLDAAAREQQNEHSGANRSDTRETMVVIWPPT